MADRITPQQAREALWAMSTWLGDAAPESRKLLAAFIDQAPEATGEPPEWQVEAIAKAIYDQWVDMPRWVKWTPGGNSDMQCKAREIARAALSPPQRPQGQEGG